MIKNRDKKLEENKEFKNVTPLKSPERLNFRASEKILIVKFNKEFDKIKDDIIELQAQLEAQKSARNSNIIKNNELSQSNEFYSQTEVISIRESKTTFNYNMVVCVMV